jgi:hypothetical protein
MRQSGQNYQNRQGHGAYSGDFPSNNNLNPALPLQDNIAIGSDSGINQSANHLNSDS